MVLQKAMKQGRNVHGIPLLDACSDHNIYIKDVWSRWGACLLRFSFKVVTGLAHSVSNCKSQTFF